MKRKDYWASRDELILAILEIAYYGALFVSLWWLLNPNNQATLGEFIAVIAANAVIFFAVNYLSRRTRERSTMEKIILTGLSAMFLIVTIAVQLPIVVLFKGLFGAKNFIITRVKQFARCEARRYGHPKSSVQDEEVHT